jgi:hypothetical protein
MDGKNWILQRGIEAMRIYAIKDYRQVIVQTECELLCISLNNRTTFSFVGINKIKDA